MVDGEIGLALLCELRGFSESRQRRDERARDRFYRINSNRCLTQVRINRMDPFSGGLFSIVAHEFGSLPAVAHLGDQRLVVPVVETSLFIKTALFHYTECHWIPGHHCRSARNDNLLPQVPGFTLRNSAMASCDFLCGPLR